MRCALLFLLVGCVTTGSRTADATTNAKTWASSMGMDIKGVACSGVDSDGDGYVSCSVNMTDGSIRAVECGYDQMDAMLIITGQNTGCKLATPVSVTGQ